MATRLDFARWTNPPCDTHSHIYPDTGNGQRNDAALEDYLRVAQSLGVSRHVIVHSKAHRHDPQCTLDTVARIGLDRARAVVWEEAHWNDADLERLHRAGVRGVRTIYPKGVPVDQAALRNTAAKVGPLGWHVLVQAEGDAWLDCADALAKLPCTVVADHIGRFGPDVTPDAPAFRSLERFVREGGWIKLSAPYYGTPGQASDFRLMAARLHALLEAGGSRAIWGLNWPHVNLESDRRPNEAATLESLWEVVGSLSQMRAVLADNAARLYDFTTAAVRAGRDC